MVQFVRKIIDSTMLENIVEIPVELKNKKIEMLLLPLNSNKSEIKKSFDPRKFRGAAKIDEEILNKQIKDLRDEWQRFD